MSVLPFSEVCGGRDDDGNRDDVRERHSHKSVDEDAGELPIRF
jgi:hypothetical protein